MDRWRNIRTFAAVVRSSVAVRDAFKGNLLLTWWWHLILALHGKPSRTSLSMQERCWCIADGFRSYGLLYRMLALFLGGLALLCSFYQITDFFWIALLSASGVYLWVTSGLAFTGATEYYNSTGERVWHLVAFLFFIALFLIAAVTSISIQVRSSAWLPDAANCIVTLGVVAFGAGSYLVELAALVANMSVTKGTEFHD